MRNLEEFWPRGNDLPIMFVDVVGEEGLNKIGSNKGKSKVGMDSKYNMKEAELVVSDIAHCCELSVLPLPPSLPSLSLPPSPFTCI